MSKKLKSGETHLPMGPKRRHGGYAFLTRGTLPEHRRYIERYLTVARESLIRDLGPTEQDLTAAQVIIIDRIISKLGVIRCIEEYIRENSVMVGQRVAPALRETYLAYDNSIRLGLTALGISTKRADESLDVQGYIKQFDEKEKRKKERKKGAKK